jgi:beta-lactamase superfamily II metal-dependent hydrolase
VSLLAGLLFATLAAWSPGTLDIHHISTGRGNASLFVLPDGTTLLVDAGGVVADVPGAEPRPDGTRRPGEWIARYVRRTLGEGASLDYVLVSHFHADHVAGLADVAAEVPISEVLDRAFPDYDFPVALDDPIVTAYRELVAARGLEVARFLPGRADQIALRHEPGAYPSFRIRNLTANGEYWTGVGSETRHHFPRLEDVPREDFPSENACSLSFRLSYGAFDYFTGGDLTGEPNLGYPAWHDMEAAIAGIVGPVEVYAVNHHGSIDTATPAMLAALRPRVSIVPAWSATHPSPSVLKRLLAERAYAGPRDVFILELREATKATIGPRAGQVASDSGHVVVRVAPGGASYEVFVVSDADESGEVLSRHGPYVSR